MIHSKLETMPRAELLAWQAQRLREVHGVSELGTARITRKDALGSMQAAQPPLAGFDKGAMQRLFASPGPTYVPQGVAEDYWRFRMAFAATGFKAGDVVMNTLSYHLTPGGFMLDSGLRALGCVVIPAGTGNTDLQVRVASHLKASGYAGTPSFLRTLLLHAKEASVPLYFKNAFATAEMLPESLRTELQSHGIHVAQAYATADLGVLAYECEERNGMHLQPECIVEIVDGEVVGTTFDASYPLLRFATGDLSEFLPDEPCACGRTGRKIKGILGRVGDAVKVKGMFVRASQMGEVMKRFGVEKWQAVITREDHQDHLTYVIDKAPPAGLADALRDEVKVRGDVQLGAPGEKKLDDRRVWK